MQTFTKITSSVIPLALKDVDTDMIIPAQYLTQINKQGYGQYLFQRLREQDPNFVFNQPQYKQAQILLAEANFGCGSSREHAVWALLQAGIQVVIAESFSDIFFNNAAKNGLLLVSVDALLTKQWFSQAQTKDLYLTVDLATQQIQEVAGKSYHFDYDPFRKDCLLQGYDDLDYLLAAMADIDQFYAKQQRVGE
jgi:3-isopropylmalate/(R)-2-methylmalate dehydratase small subunit